jgi:Tol biopolymer transport system component/predicted Ser/Thr protein kinase
MALTLGSKLGSYDVLSLLGAGGMGEVYRARDTRLGRVVAIKVLPSERMADENRRRRFVQETRAASALNHPNIVTIHEIESADGIDFIVMEYVEGKMLDTLISRQEMSLGEVLRVAIPIADALARAHAAGIVHRDLKPANVMIGSDGVVKVLDFGLAKLVILEPGSPDHETVSEDGDAGPLSRPGTVPGTAGYMSPEQAMGKEVDSRSDVFSFGAMLYEMVTGRRAFTGSSTAETLAAVVRDQPKAPSEVVPAAPKELDRLVQRCLQKEPERRFQHMLDVKLELEQIKEESESRRVAAVPARSKRRRWLVVGLAGLLAMAAGAWLLLRPPPPPPRVVQVTSMRGFEAFPALSPDGEQVAFVWNGEKQDNLDVYIQMIGSPEVRRLTTDPALDGTPSWSPDGRQIAFVRYRFPDPTGTIQLVSPLGGSDRRVADFLTAGGRPSWSPDGRWLVAARARPGAEPGPTRGSRSDGLYLVPVQGGEPRPIPLPEGAGEPYNPMFSPDGRHLAYQSCVGVASCHVDVVELSADFVPKGAPRRLSRRPIYPFGDLAWTRDGKSVLFVDAVIRRIWRVGIDGKEPPTPIELAGLHAMHPATAASRDRLVFVQELTNVDIYRFETGRPAEPVLASSFADYNPRFSPDGRRVAFETERSGDEHEIWLADPDGFNPSQLTRGPGLVQGSPFWSPDGRRIAFDSQGEDGHWDIWTIDADGGSPRRLTQGPGDENSPSWSRDGRSVYFAARREGGPPEVWRIPAAGGTEERMTHGGGFFSCESIDGQTLFFSRGLEASPLLALPLAGGPERRVVECVSSFAVGSGGVYYVGCGGDDSTLFLRNPATGRERLLGKLVGWIAGITISPDGKTIRYGKVVGEGSDLMMIENFRWPSGQHDHALGPGGAEGARRHAGTGERC